MTNLLKRPVSACLAIVAAFAVSGCGDAQDQKYYADQNGQWVEITAAEYRMTQQAQNGLSPDHPLYAAIARNPNSARIPADIANTPFPELSDAQIADLSVAAAREICNIPEGQPITPDTPCAF